MAKDMGFVSLERMVPGGEASGGDNVEGGSVSVCWGGVWRNFWEVNCSPSVMGAITSSLRAGGMGLQGPRETAGL